jgi:Fe-S cluster biogenesis protein NfuA
MTTLENDLYERVENALDAIRPYLQTDGGDVKIIEITNTGVLRIELMGSCGNCPMSPMTMKAGIEESVKKSVPEITSIEAVNV